MRLSLAHALAVLALGSTLGCESEPLGQDTSSGGNGSGGNPTAGGNPAAGGNTGSMCSAALRQAVSLVDEVATTAVEVLDTSSEETTFYVDATAPAGQDQSAWVYVSLASGTKVALTDLEALESRDWDLAFKRASIRTNGGDSGPGQGGAFKVRLPWSSVNAATLGDQPVPTEQWFDEDCNLLEEPITGVITTFSGWNEYDQATHVLTPADAVFLTRGADGSLYKVAILDYYANPDGTSGRVAARYKVRLAALP